MELLSNTSQVELSIPAKALYLALANIASGEFNEEHVMPTDFNFLMDLGLTFKELQSCPVELELIGLCKFDDHNHGKRFSLLKSDMVKVVTRDNKVARVIEQKDCKFDIYENRGSITGNIQIAQLQAS